MTNAKEHGASCETSRSAAIDIARAIGIALVVLGHNPVSRFPETLPIWHVVNSFHMPLFFFLSGWFFRPERTLSQHVILRLKSLARPLLATSLLYAAMRIVLRDASLAETQDILFRNLALCTFSSLDWPIMALWFVACLFVVQVLFRCVSPWLLRVPWLTGRLLILGVVLVCGIAIIRLFGAPSDQAAPPWLRQVRLWGGLPWNLDLFPLAAFFLGLGYESRPWFTRLDKTRGLLLACCAILLFCWLHVAFPAVLDLAERRYENGLVCTLEALLGILVTLLTAFALSAKGPRWIVTAFTFLGRHTLEILVFHHYIQIKSCSTFEQMPWLGGGMPYVLSYILGILGPILLTQGALRWVPGLRDCYGLVVTRPNRKT